MFFLLLTAIYISISCWALGNCIIRLSKNRHDWLTNTTTQLLIGLCGYSFIAGCWTLLLPTGKQLQHLPISIFTITYCLLYRPWHEVRKKARLFFRNQKAVTVSLGVMIFLLLLMGSWKITHPDTLGYHAGIMSWIDAFKAIPGLANLQLRLGYQGQWFPLCSFLTPKLIQSNNTINALNLTVCIWFLLFVGRKIADPDYHNQKVYWLLLLLVSFSSYTQIRLTATSASPDFISALLVWWVVFEIYNYKQNFFQHCLITIVAITAVSFKLSAIVICLIVVAWIFQYTYRKLLAKAVVLISICAILLMPFFIRNIISTGYLAFPLPQLAITALPWTFPPRVAQLDQAYIKAYARARVVYDREVITQINQQRFWQWMPKWWEMQSIGDKTILFVSLILTLMGLLNARRWKHLPPNHGYIISVLIIGVFFWMSQAPDPRFGFIYIIPLGAIGLCSTRSGIIQVVKKKYKLLFFASFCLCMLYIGYRLHKFFSPQQLVTPLGIKNPSYTKYECKGIIWYRPTNSLNCIGLDAPCLPISCNEVKPIGTHVSDGFLPLE